MRDRAGLRPPARGRRSARASGPASSEALRHFLAEIEAGGAGAPAGRLPALGRGEMRAGRSLESLLSAYRIGARVAWRRFAAAGVERRAGARHAVPAGRVDLRLHRRAVGGVGRGLRARAVGRRRRGRAAAPPAGADARARPAADPDAVARGRGRGRLGAAARRWRSVAIGGERRETRRVAAAAGHDQRDDRRARSCALVADPDGPGQRAALERAVRRRRGAGGPGHDRRLDRRRGSASRGRGRRSSWPTRRRELVAARENAGELLLRSRPRAGRRAGRRPAGAAARALGRLAPAALRRRWRCGWPSRAGWGRSPSDSAIHPQTARYRLGRLRELFGDALDDPDARFWLELALRVAGSAADAATLSDRVRPAGRGDRGGPGSAAARLGRSTSGPSAPAAISSAQA